MNGISLSSIIGGGWGGGTIPNAAGVSEMLFDTSSVDAQPLDRRHTDQLHHQGRRQQILGDGLRQLRERLDAGRQPRAPEGIPRLTTPGGIVKNWDFNPGFRRTHRERQTVVLSVGPQPGREYLRAGPVLQQEREQPERVGVRARYGAARDTESLVAGLSGPRDVAGELRRTSSASCTTSRATVSARSASTRSPRRKPATTSGSRCSVRSRWTGRRRSPASCCSKVAQSTVSSGGAPWTPRRSRLA